MPLGHKKQDGVAEQIEIANRLYESDKRQNETVQERLSATQTAEAMGIPAYYMEEAAAEIASRTAAQARHRKRLRITGFLSLVPIIAGLSTWVMTHRHTLTVKPPPLVYDFTVANQGQWQLDSNNGGIPLPSAYGGRPEARLSFSFSPRARTSGCLGESEAVLSSQRTLRRILC